MRPRAPDAGFTLAELLVALGLLALAAVLVARSFSVDRAALHRVEARAGEVEDVAATQDLLRDRLEHLFPAVRFDSEGPKLLFTGANDRVDFLTAGWGRDAGPARPVQRYRLERSDAGELELEELAPGDDPAPVQGRTVLLRGIRALDVDYYGTLRSGAPAGWRADWAGSSMAPELVRMRVGFADRDRRRWPELIVRPAAEIDTACILDPATLTCRGRA